MHIDITKEYTVWCSVCGDWLQTTSKSQAKAIKIFKKQGYKIKDSRFICAKCVMDK